MQWIGGGGRPMFPLLLCYVPLAIAGALALPLLCIDDRNHQAPYRLPVLSLIVFGAYLLLRSFLGGDAGLRGFEMLRIAGTMLVYLVFAGAVSSGAPRLLFVWVVLASAFFQSASEMFQLYCDASWKPALMLFPQLQGINADGPGTFANKNHLAWLLGDAVLFGMAMACWGRWGWVGRVLLFYVTAFCAAGLLLSLSRGGTVALAGGMACFMLL